MSIMTMVYSKQDCITFKKVNEKFGGLSNMSPLSLEVNGIKFKTCESLYQVCRFPSHPEVQKEIIEQKSPMSAKMVGKKYKKLNYTRPNFGDDNDSSLMNNDRIKIMEWCLRVKLACNLDEFGSLLRRTGEKSIVEDAPTKSHIFWGAFENEVNSDLLIGKNVLGRLLMKLRDEYLEKWKMKQTIDFLVVEPLKIDNFKLFGKDIGRIDNRKKIF